MPITRRFNSSQEGRRGSSGSERGGSPRSWDRDSSDGRTRFVRKKVCRLCAERIAGLDYKDTDRLLKFLTEKGKIFPQRISGNCSSHQRMLARAVKKARHAALIPFQIG